MATTTGGHNLPGWLAILTHINPVSYGVDAMRRIVLSHAGCSREW